MFSALCTQTALVPEGYNAAGAISTQGGVTVLIANQFINNTAASHGGAVAYRDDCFTVSDTSGVVRHICTTYLFVACVCNFLTGIECPQCSVGCLG